MRTAYTAVVAMMSSVMRAFVVHLLTRFVFVEGLEYFSRVHFGFG
jgi:hypothetical protein